MHAGEKKIENHEAKWKDAICLCNRQMSMQLTFSDANSGIMTSHD